MNISNNYSSNSIMKANNVSSSFMMNSKQQQSFYEEGNSFNNNSILNKNNPNAINNPTKAGADDLYINNLDLYIKYLFNKRIKVNFSLELQEIIKETKYLDRMGIKIPILACNISLQQDNLFLLHDQLNKLINEYDLVLSKMSNIEKKLLIYRINDLLYILQAGLTILNWNSFGINDFIQTTEIAIRDFVIILSHVHYNTKLIYEDISN